MTYQGQVDAFEYWTKKILSGRNLCVYLQTPIYLFFLGSAFPNTSFYAIYYFYSDVYDLRIYIPV